MQRWQILRKVVEEEDKEDSEIRSSTNNHSLDLDVE